MRFTGVTTKDSQGTGQGRRGPQGESVFGQGFRDFRHRRPAGEAPRDIRPIASSDWRVRLRSFVMPVRTRKWDYR